MEINLLVTKEKRDKREKKEMEKYRDIKKFLQPVDVVMYS